MQPDIRIIPINETEYWQDGTIKEAAKEIANVYVFDANLATHLCSLAPSYWLEYVGVITKERVNDDIHNSILTGLCDPQSNYYNGKILSAKHIKESCYDNDFPGYEDQEAYDEWFSDILDSLLCNGASFELECFELLGWN